MKRFRPSLITAAFVASGMALAGSNAFAQDVDADQPEALNDQIEKIEVRGFSTSLIKSLN